MPEPTKSSSLSLGLAVGVIALMVVAAFMTRRGPQEAQGEVDRTWYFASVRVTDDPAKPSNAILIHTGDKLMGWSAQTDEHCYSFLQDSVKLEANAEESRELDNNGQILEVVGVQLGDGRGQVQLVVLCAPKPIPSVPVVLSTINAFPLKPEQRLEALLKGVQKLPGQAGVRIAPSGWYTLNYDGPIGDAGGVEGAPKLPARVEAGEGSGAAAGADAGAAAGATVVVPPGAGEAGSGMGSDGVPAGNAGALPVTPR